MYPVYRRSKSKQKSNADQLRLLGQRKRVLKQISKTKITTIIYVCRWWRSSKTAKNWDCSSPRRQQVCKPLAPIFWRIMYCVEMFYACVCVHACCTICNERKNKRNSVFHIRRNPTIHNNSLGITCSWDTIITLTLKLFCYNRLTEGINREQEITITKCQPHRI